jgi:hypothetical protein
VAGVAHCAPGCANLFVLAEVSGNRGITLQRGASAAD